MELIGFYPTWSDTEMVYLNKDFITAIWPRCFMRGKILRKVKHYGSAISFSTYSNIAVQHRPKTYLRCYTKYRLNECQQFTA